MSIYKENPENLEYEVSGSSNKVFIQVDCFNGTLTSVSFYHKKLKTVRCGEKKEIGKASELINKVIEFNGTATNPGDEDIQILHTIYEEGEEPLEYTFPDDYDGEPDYDEDDKHPDYRFKVNFILGKI